MAARIYFDNAATTSARSPRARGHAALSGAVLGQSLQSALRGPAGPRGGRDGPAPGGRPCSAPSRRNRLHLRRHRGRQPGDLRRLGGGRVPRLPPGRQRHRASGRARLLPAIGATGASRRPRFRSTARAWSIRPSWSGPCGPRRGWSRSWRPITWWARLQPVAELARIARRHGACSTPTPCRPWARCLATWRRSRLTCCRCRPTSSTGPKASGPCTSARASSLAAVARRGPGAGPPLGHGERGRHRRAGAGRRAGPAEMAARDRPAGPDPRSAAGRHPRAGRQSPT